MLFKSGYVKKIIFSLLLGFSCFKITATTWTINNSGNSFSPPTLTINVGDAVNFDISTVHNAKEVSQDTWNANGTTALTGGFLTNFGGGLVPAASLGLGTHYYVCDPHASAGMKGRIIVQNCTPPSQPLSITGNTTVCQSSLNNYSITAVSGATSYTWTLPSGWSGTSTSTSISVNAGSTSGTISVTANNSCSSSPARTLNVTVNNLPSTPAAISGNASVCPGTTNAYSITSVAGAASYSWVLPAGWSGSSTSTSISATAGAGGGTISVSANNSCGSSPAATLNISNSGLQEIPGNITGNTLVCQGSSNTYSIPAVNGASSYTWTLPPGWTGVSTTNSINAVANTSGGNITVTANNTCGSTSPKTLGITLSTVPAIPGTITGMTTLCSGSVVVYSIAAVAGAASYTWSLPSGWTGSSTANSISAAAFNNSGDVTVKANNSCGSSPVKTLNVTVNNLPATPGNISGSSTICAGSSNAYSITNVPGATSYSWTLPSGWTGSSTINSITATAGTIGGSISVSANNSCGSSGAKTLNITINSLPDIAGTITGSATICPASSNTYSISPVNGAANYTWILPTGWTGTSSTNSILATAGTAGGTVSVTANNTCGSTPPKTLNVTISTNLPKPDTISGSTSFCPGNSFTYSITPISGAVSYTWTLPSGWTGSSTTNSIITTAGVFAGNITVKANNSCGSSAIASLAVTGTGSVPAKPGSISGNASICAGSSNTYTVPAADGATNYTWTLPVGWTGASSTNSIITTAGTGSGNITVRANNFCGSSTTVTLAVSASAAVPALPGTISGNTAVCTGSKSIYSIVPVNGATSYTWTLPFGWSGSSSVNSIEVTPGSFSGLIIVTANNACGSSPDKVLGVSIPVLNTAVKQMGNTLTSEAGESTFQWINCSNGNQPIPGQTNASFTAVAPGNYAVIVTRNNCSDTSDCFNLTTVGWRDKINEPSVIVYPNPSRGTLRIKMDDEHFKVNSNLEIYNLNGRLVYQSILKSPDSKIELHVQEQGIYYLKLYSDQYVISKMILVQ